VPPLVVVKSFQNFKELSKNTTREVEIHSGSRINSHTGKGKGEETNTQICQGGRLTEKLHIRQVANSASRLVRGKQFSPSR
jgi:hypothetical protein